MFHVKQKYDVIIVGAGHAGVEAATMASRLGMRVAIVTFDAGDIIGISFDVIDEKDRDRVKKKVSLNHKVLEITKKNLKQFERNIIFFCNTLSNELII